MNDSNCSRHCLMKLDLQNSIDKIAFLKDNWPSFGQIESIDELSKQELKCTLCLLNVLIDACVNDEAICSSQEVAQLVIIRMYVENSIELIDLKRLQAEHEKLG